MASIHHLSSDNGTQGKTETVCGGTKSISLKLRNLSLIFPFILLNCRHLQLCRDCHLPLWPLLLLNLQISMIQQAVSVLNSSHCLLVSSTDLWHPSSGLATPINCLPSPSVGLLFTLCWNYPEGLSSPCMLWVYSLRSFYTKLTLFNCSRQPRNEAATKKSLPCQLSEASQACVGA